MARDLTSDINSPAITHVCLDEDRVELARRADLSINLEASTLTVVFGFYSADGVRRRTVEFSRRGDQLQGVSSVINPYRAYRTALLAAAQAAGIIPDGTDTQDL